MENPPLIDDFPMNTSASRGFPASHVRVPKDTNWGEKLDYLIEPLRSRLNSPK